MSYINSNNINVFPIAKTRPNDIYSRSFTEHNMTSWLSSVTDSQCWVIDYSGASVVTGGNLHVGSLKFFLNGYLFSVTDSTLPVDAQGNVRVALDYSNSDSDNPELKQDSNTEYQGVKFLGSEDLDSDSVASVLFHISGSDGAYNIEPRYVKFQQGSIEITKIDGKRSLTIDQ